MIYVATQFEII